MRQPGIYVDVPLPSKEAIAARPRYFALQRKLHGLDLEREERLSREALKANKKKRKKRKQGSPDANSSLNQGTSALVEPVQGGSDQSNKMPAKTRAADSSIMIIDSSDEDNDAVQQPARQRRLVRGSRPQRRVSSEGDVEVAKLGPDDEIDKIFGRKEHSEHGMLYTVRLSDKRKVTVRAFPRK
jgi:hypothetical protein